jgi:vacuolar iron transporter family protein
LLVGLRAETYPGRVSTQTPSRSDVSRWRRHLADERGTAAVMRSLADRRAGEERRILLQLAEAEERHASHWVHLLGERATPDPAPSLQHRLWAGLASRFGSLFVLALLQREKGNTSYAADTDASAAMAADEIIHEEVLRGLAARGRAQLSGNFRAAVFGANDGLVSNLALVMGMSATGVGSGVVLAAGMAGLLAGALSMAAGEYISVRSARELLAASQPGAEAQDALRHLDLDANDLELVYRARGMELEDARSKAGDVLRAAHRDGRVPADAVPAAEADVDEHEAVGNAWGAAVSSFFFFASGALIPVLPYLFGLTATSALLVAAALVGLALLLTGGVVGLLSGASPLRRGVRQLLIGYGAAAVTYLLGLAFGATGIG